MWGGRRTAPLQSAPLCSSPHRSGPLEGGRRATLSWKNGAVGDARWTDNDSLRRENVRLCAKLLKHDLFHKCPES